MKLQLQKNHHPALFARVDTWIGRLKNFIYGSKEADNDEMYQVNQAKIAIAKGGVLELVPATVQQEIIYRRHTMISFLPSSLKNMD